jgi:hypothetical protein
MFRAATVREREIAFVSTRSLTVAALNTDPGGIPV